MYLSQVRKKGNVKIRSIDEKIKERLQDFGIKEGSLLFVSGVHAGGYGVILCDDRLIAVPDQMMQGIVV